MQHQPSDPAPSLPYGKRNRHLFLLVAVLGIATQGGVVYGWPSMRAILRREQVLMPSSCLVNASSASNLTVCKEQELAFGAIYTFGAWSNQGGRLFLGMLVDHSGPRISCVISSLLFACGSAIFSHSLGSLAGLSVGFFLIGFGGAGAQIAVQSVAALYNENRSTAMASLSGAFQFASGFYLYYDLFNRNSAVSLNTLLLIHAAIAIVMATLAFAVLPMQAFGVATSRSSLPVVVLKGQTDESTASAVNGGVAATATRDVDSVPLKARSFWQQALSPEFARVTAFFTVGVLQCQFTVATIGVQLDLKGDQAGAGTRLFAAAMVASCLWTPLYGQLIDRLGFGFGLSLLNCLLLVALGGLIAPSLGLAYAAVAFFYPIGRLSHWATFFAYLACVFGFRHFGKLVGLGMTVAALVSLLQYPLLELTFRAFDGSFVAVNTLFSALHMLSFLLVPGMHRAAAKAR